MDDFDKVETFDTSTGKWRVWPVFYNTFRKYLNKFRVQFCTGEYPSLTAELDKLTKNLVLLEHDKYVEYAPFLPADYFEHAVECEIRQLKKEFCDGLWKYLTITRTQVGPDRFKYKCELTIVVNPFEQRIGND